VNAVAPNPESPFDYLKDVLLRIATHPQRAIGHAPRLGRDLRTPRGHLARRAISILM
jgi:hypothetical protein